MKFEKIPADAKKKCMDKIIKQIKERMKDKTDDVLYSECKIAGFMMYEFLAQYASEND